MRYTKVGAAGLTLSRIGFGCGDNARLMVGDDRGAQEATVGRALAAGITYFDTAAKYGGGRSEENLGRALRGLRTDARGAVVGSKLLLDPGPGRVTPADVRARVGESLRRLGRDRIELYQLHDRIASAPGRGWSPPGSRTLTPAELLAPGGIVETLLDLRRDGLVGELGLTSYGGEPAAVAEVLASGAFASVNCSVHMLNPTALLPATPGWPALDYEGVAAGAAARGLAVLGIRALGGGRLLRARDAAGPGRREADRDVCWDPALGETVETVLDEHGPSPVRAALGWVLAWPAVTTLICGISAPEHVDDAAAAEAGAPAWSQAAARSWAERLLGCVTPTVSAGGPRRRR